MASASGLGRVRGTGPDAGPACPKAARPPFLDPSTHTPPLLRTGPHRSPNLLHALTCAGPGCGVACGLRRGLARPSRGEVRRRPRSGPLPGSAHPAPRLLLCPPSGARRCRRGQPWPCQAGLCAWGEGPCPLVGSRAPTELPLGQKVADEPLRPQEPPQPRGGGSLCFPSSASGPPSPLGPQGPPFSQTCLQQPHC